VRSVEPKVFLVGETRVNQGGLSGYLEHIGVPDWVSDAPSDSEYLIEAFGRVCYRSWQPGMNKNVTKVREHNDEYMANLIKSGHGSVLEHASVNFIFADVSRVFTHELVRHRAGVAISQESLRYVRLSDLGVWLPTVIREDNAVTEVFVKTIEQLEELQVALAQHFDLDATTEEGKVKIPFSTKKKITSAMRRVAPIGLATTIGWSANMRALRWVLEMRTHPSAEEEIRFVFSKVGEIVVSKYPHLFADFSVQEVDGLPQYVSGQHKV